MADKLDIPVTTGDAYTIAMSVESIKQAAVMMGTSLQSSCVAIVGATGAIGKVCAQLLAPEAGEMILIARRMDALEELRDELVTQGAAGNILVSTNMEDLRKANLVLTVTSAVHAIIDPQFIRPGSVVCDVARPRNVAAQVASQRSDVLVIDGGMVEVPGPVDFHFDFGFPAGKAYACMAETMALALEGRFEDYTLGKDIKIDQVKEIQAIASKHGFRLSGFRSFDKPVSEEQVERVRRNVRNRLGHFVVLGG